MSDVDTMRPKAKTNLKSGTVLHDASWNIGENADGLFVKKEQYISDEFLQANADARFDSKERSREFHRFASVPVVVVEQWLKQGFDVYKESPKAIVKRLRAENLEAFLTSNKSL
jgi:hypothetical protein